MKPSAEAVKPATKPLSRAERKAQLLAELEQQRVDILVDSEYLQQAASPLDQSWKSFRLPLYIVGGMAAFKIVRHPGGAMAAGRTALAGYMLLKKLKLLAKVAT
ncbi:YqjK family protein [Halomonas sp. SpR8]|uniref:YqjK family protein n=1 Tax=Halomonas sp. SpR8 TaxID=3050463 RepID=UPI0027E46794|nr:YqjK family protein [Halomonas sp. SpR8]MDQ7728385.1 YqjK family protein [Halomonas sp. SpR8]